VAGSYTDKVGGHNILEPALYGIPVFFGPHMFCQQELASYILKAKAGKQVPLNELRNSIDHFFNSPQQEFLFRQATQSLSLFSNGVTQKILSLVEGK
jgi:3-deoxy-D-manno-octulosonic-acid transferase